MGVSYYTASLEVMVGLDNAPPFDFHALRAIRIDQVRRLVLRLFRQGLVEELREREDMANEVPEDLLLDISHRIVGVGWRE